MIALPITAEAIRGMQPGDSYSMECAVLSRSAHIASIAALERSKGAAYAEYPISFGDLYDSVKMTLEEAGFTVLLVTVGHKFRLGAKVWRITWGD